MPIRFLPDVELVVRQEGDLPVALRRSVTGQRAPLSGIERVLAGILTNGVESEEQLLHQASLSFQVERTTVTAFLGRMAEENLIEGDTRSEDRDDGLTAVDTMIDPFTAFSPDDVSAGDEATQIQIKDQPYLEDAATMANRQGYNHQDARGHGAAPAHPPLEERETRPVLAGSMKAPHPQRVLDELRPPPEDDTDAMTVVASRSQRPARRSPIRPVAPVRAPYPLPPTSTEDEVPISGAPLPNPARLKQSSSPARRARRSAAQEEPQQEQSLSVSDEEPSRVPHLAPQRTRLPGRRYFLAGLLVSMVAVAIIGASAFILRSYLFRGDRATRVTPAPPPEKPLCDPLAVDRHDLRCPIAGRVTRVLSQQGAEVEKGQVLVTVKDEQRLAEIEDQRAQLESEGDLLRIMRSGGSNIDVKRQTLLKKQLTSKLKTLEPSCKGDDLCAYEIKKVKKELEMATLKLKRCDWMAFPQEVKAQQEKIESLKKTLDEQERGPLEIEVKSTVKGRLEHLVAVKVVVPKGGMIGTVVSRKCPAQGL